MAEIAKRKNIFLETVWRTQPRQLKLFCLNSTIFHIELVAMADKAVPVSYVSYNRVSVYSKHMAGKKSKRNQR